jgi:pimeloyl-ACP methyl ester carboxylesterase
LEHLGRDRATVVGHSLGGGVAMQFAYQYHDRCERLVLVDSGGLGREVSWYLRAGTVPGAELVMPLIANRYVLHAGQAAGRALSRLPLRQLRPSSLEVFRGYTVLAESPARSAFVHTLRSVVEPGGQRVNATDRLYLAQGRPTLIVWGALDTVIPVHHAYEAHAALPGSQLEIFEQSEHFPHMDEPARFARVLTGFLNATESGAIDRETLRARITARASAHANAPGAVSEGPQPAGSPDGPGPEPAPDSPLSSHDAGQATPPQQAGPSSGSAS